MMIKQLENELTEWYSNESFNVELVTGYTMSQAFNNPV